MTHGTEREALVEQLERDEEELRRAVDEIKDVVARPLEIVEKVTQVPIPWVLTGILFGIWLGSRHSAEHHKEYWR
jgi:hypothetical protein